MLLRISASESVLLSNNVPFISIFQAVDLELDATPFLGNVRSKRYSMLIEDGVVKQLQLEPDGTGLSCSLSNGLLGLL